MYVSFVYKELHRAVLVTEAFVLHAWLPLVIYLRVVARLLQQRRLCYEHLWQH